MDPEAIRQKRKVLLEQWCTQHQPRYEYRIKMRCPSNIYLLQTRPGHALRGIYPLMEPISTVEQPDDDTDRTKPKEEEAPASKSPLTIPVELECIIQDIATTSLVPYSWEDVRFLLAAKLEHECRTAWEADTDKYFETMEEFSDNAIRPLIKSLLHERRAGPPFSTQRFCELLMDREKWYKTTRKYCNALTKVLTITMSYPYAPELSRKRKAPDPGSPVSLPDVDDREVAIASSEEIEREKKETKKEFKAAAIEEASSDGLTSK